MTEAFRIAGETHGIHPWEELSFVVPTLPEAEATTLLATMLSAVDPAHPDGTWSILAPMHRKAILARLLEAYPKAVGAEREQLAGWLVALGGEDEAQVVANTLDDAELAKLWRAQGGLRRHWLRARAYSVLGDLERAKVLVGALASAPTMQDRIALLGVLSALPMKEVTPALINDIRPSPPGFGTTATEHAQWSKLVLRWLHDSQDSAVRAAAARWVGLWVTLDFRPPCAEALTALCASAESDPDAGVRAEAKKELARHFNEGPFPGDDEAEAQGRVLAGSLDDREEMKRVDALAPQVGAAIDAPAPAPVPEPAAPPAKSGDF
jgi:hypothetical protein